LTSFRSSPFPFFKLPLEVRERIYKLLLGPFYEYHESIKKSFIAVYLGPDSKSGFDLDDEEETFEDELKFGSVNKRLGLGEITFEEYQIEEAEYYKSKDASRHRPASHPGRDRDYELSAYPIRQTARSVYEDNQYWLSLEWIRQASNISLQFRKELVDVFWRRTLISTEVVAGAIWILPDFLEERPGIHLGIKYLNLSLEVSEEPPYYLSENFENWCDYISYTLKLEKLQLDIIVEEEDVKQLGSGKGWFACLACARKLQATRSFKVSVSIVNSSESKRLQRPEKECEARLQELMMPDTLR
jgi:hypothetical protein